MEIIFPNSTALTISWEPPPLEHQNGAIVAYTVMIRSYRLDGALDEIYENITDTSITITALEIFTEYSVEILATTKAGLGPTASVVARTLNDSEYDGTIASQLCIGFNI